MKPTLNLASRTYLNRRLLYASYGFALMVLVAALAAAAFQLWSGYRQTAHLGQEIADLERRLAARDGAAEEETVAPADYARLRERIAFANSLIHKDAFRWTEVLDKLENVVPDGVGLRDIRPEFEKGSLHVTGLARNLEKLQALLDNLLESPYFSAVLLLSQERLDAQQNRGTEALGFTVVLQGAF